jgi:ELWxxDGT repeat protein
LVLHASVSTADELTPVLLPVTTQVDLGSNLSSGIALGGHGYFGATNYHGPAQLWETDGTSAGTQPLAAVAPAGDSVDFLDVAKVGGVLYFVVWDHTNVGQTLWRSDGTSGGTASVTLPKDAEIEELAADGDRLYLAMGDAAHGTELWRLDPGDASPSLVKDIAPGEAGSFPAQLTPTAGQLFFVANDQVHGPELWVSDGTDAGTKLVKDLEPGSSGTGPTGLFAMGSGVYFGAYQTDTGDELWHSDGTAADTSLVADINPGNAGSSPGNFAALGSEVYFSAASAGVSQHLWRTDGTAGGTQPVPGAAVPPPATMLHLGSSLYFFVWNDPSGPQLWRTDASGAVLVRDFPNTHVSSFESTGTQLLFGINAGVGGYRLWRSDGTTSGTNQAGAVGLVGSPWVLGDLLMFSGNDGSHGAEPWRSDGTQAGTFMVKNVNTATPATYATRPTRFNGTWYFAADDGAGTSELWRTDGTPAGTELFSHVGEPLNPLAVLGGELLYQGWDSTYASQLYETDGTPGGTQRVTSVDGGTSSGLLPHDMLVMGGYALFAGRDVAHGPQLWRTDGSTGGTAPVTNVGSSSGGIEVHSLVRLGSVAYFTAVSPFGSDPGQLWRTDGTADGTVPVTQLPASEFGVTDVIAAGDRIYFTTGPYGSRLWTSDGTWSGTHLVMAADPDLDLRSVIGNLSVSGNGLYFSEGGDFDANLWRLDLTSGDLTKLHAFEGNSWDNGAPLEVTPMGSGVVFSAGDAIAGRQLWCSNGTPQGTIRLAFDHAWDGTLSPKASSNPGSFAELGGYIYYSAFDPDHGDELWRTDGSPAGTSLVSDVSPGPDSSSPMQLSPLGDRLFFTASSWPSLGQPWVVVPAGNPAGEPSCRPDGSPSGGGAQAPSSGTSGTSGPNPSTGTEGGSPQSGMKRPFGAPVGVRMGKTHLRFGERFTERGHVSWKLLMIGPRAARTTLMSHRQDIVRRGLAQVAMGIHARARRLLSRYPRRALKLRVAFVPAAAAIPATAEFTLAR